MEKSIFCYVYILRQFDYNWLYGWDESKASFAFGHIIWQIGSVGQSNRRFGWHLRLLLRAWALITLLFLLLTNPGHITLKVSPLNF